MRALIDFTQPRPGADDAPERVRLAFSHPVRELVAWAPDDIPPLLDTLETATRQGLWCVGWLAYEAAAAFDPALHTHAPEPGVPLACFGVFQAPQDAPLQPDGSLDAAANSTSADPATEAVAIDWAHLPDRAQFEADVARVKEAIAAGRCYQVNLTAPCTGVLRGSAQALFAALQQAQPGGYAACIEWEQHAVLSVSPELFFDWQADTEGRGPLLTRPMKGTAPRGATQAADAAQAQHLRTSPKERAENVMIVDLLRNDLSRVAEPFSVQVPRLFHLQALPAVWQMTSDVTATTRVGTHLRDVLGALFPCGSVTGAPKVEAMRLIQSLEPQPRGVYCGAVGMLRPRQPTAAGQPAQLHATFNVPIRTVALHGQSLRASFGSGLVADAEPAAEWAEWQHKRAFIDRVSEPFELLETLALVDGDFRHLALHLERMQRGAKHFGFAWPEAQLLTALDALAQDHPQGHWRVRLLLARHGKFSAQAFALTPTATPVRLQLSTSPFEQAQSEFVRFKTTRRGHYARHAPAPDSGVFDTILHNTRGEITECTFGNVAMQLADGQWVTPPLHCGLLPGIGREVALNAGRLAEQVVRLSDVPRIRRWAFLNSLRGWLDAELVTGFPTA